jgi:hypothetical protein
VITHTVGPAVVRWGHGRHAFEIHAVDSRVLQRAGRVFAPWIAPASFADAGCLAAWTVESSDAGWRIRSRTDAEQSVAATIAGAISHIEYCAVHALIEHAPDTLSVHGALVARDGVGVLIAGAGESGKSTLATMLWRQGYALLGDDVAVIDVARQRAASAPRRISLRTASRPLLPPDLWDDLAARDSSDVTGDRLLFHPADGGFSPSLETRLAACVFLNRPGSDLPAGVWRPVVGAVALLSLLPLTNVIRRNEAGGVIAALAPFADAIPAFDIGRGPVPLMCRTFDRLLANQC